LVDLLKHPGCVGDNRAALLRQLGRRLGPPAFPAAAIPLGGAASASVPPLAAAAGAALGESRYPGARRPFADRWEAADYLRDHHPELNLTSPLRRAGR
jgi:hypothetical protein